MANLDAPRGFKLYKMEGKTVRVKEYSKTASEEIFEGDLLMRVPAGTVEQYVAGTLPAAGRVVGVAAAYHAAANTDAVLVIDDPEATYICQCDSATAYAVADNGLNADIAASPTGSALGVSGMEIALASKATTSTLPVKVLGLAPQLNGAENAAGLHADVLCKLNHTELAGGVDGI